MSHFDDVDFVFWGDSPKGCLGFILFMIIGGLVIWWAVHEDHKSANICAEHGEKYVDSRTSYTLCEQDGGTVVRR